MVQFVNCKKTKWTIVLISNKCKCTLFILIDVNSQEKLEVKLDNLKF